VDVGFRVSNMQNFHLDGKFDAVIVMFSGMDYLILYSEIMQTLANIKEHLKEGGLFICDFWNSDADYGIGETKCVEDGNKKIRRVSHIRHLIHGYYNVLFRFDIEAGSRADTFFELHTLRAYHPDEIRCYLVEASFKVLEICPFMDLDGEINENVRDIMVIARC